MDPADEPAAGDERHATRVGLVLVTVYCLLYAGFIGLAAFGGDLLKTLRPLAGVNLAVLYGLALIVAALVLAAVYMRACRRRGDG